MLRQRLDAFSAFFATLPRRWRATLVGLALLGAALALLTSARAAISYVASAGGGSGGLGLGLNSFSISVPSGTQASDLLVAVIATDSNSAISAQDAGWTQVLVSNGSQAPRLTIFWRVADNSEPSSYGFTLPFLVSNSVAAGITAYRGVDTSSPILAAAIQANGNGTTSTAPSITPGVANATLVGVWASINNDAAPPAGMSTAYDYGGSMLFHSTVYAVMGYQTGVGAGATGTKVATVAGSGSSNAALLALRPAWSATISGTVYEDVNYGGGDGRSLAGASGAGRSGVTVELYTGAGVFKSSTTTGAGGSYAFTVNTAGNYYVRVVSGSMYSTRSGSTGAEDGVLTWRSDASSGSAVAVTDNVGGFNPALVDAGSGSAGSTFNTSTFVFSAGPSGTAQAVTPVLANADVSGVDFGFNFDVVTSTRNTGAGSLRQVITNANLLGGDASLAQSGRSAGVENVVFMISNGSAGAGLRSANNYLTTSAGSYNVATIQPTTEMPVISTTLVVDAQTQPGWALNPLVELRGDLTTAVSGITITASSTVLRGLVVNRFDNEGVHATAGNNITVQGCWIGVTAAGTAAAGNGLSAIWMDNSGTGHVVGGTTAAQRNVLSGNIADEGAAFLGGSGHVVQGNYIGTNAAGTAPIPNGRDGVKFYGAVTGATVGGTSGATANLISGNTGRGVSIVTGASGVAVLGNAIYGNGSLGIDQNIDGISANDGLKTAGQANLKMDAPVFTAASMAGTSLTVSGYVGSAAGQSLFASARVEVFVSDQSSGSGQGKTYLGFLTTNASGNFSGTLTGASAVSAGVSKITGTATDTSNNSSEFGVNFFVPVNITGSVFEDANYGGGAARNKTVSAGVGVNGARVELYNSAGTYVSATTTAASGSYGFTGLSAGVYFVRVVNSSVLSNRSGSIAALVPVMTYRAEAAGGSALDITNEVGGANPAKADAVAGSGGTSLMTVCAAENATCTFAGSRTVRYGASSGSVSGWATLVLNGGTTCSNGVFGDPLPGIVKSCYLLNADYQSLSTVNASAGDVSGVDFGFNFDTVVNTNDSGAGSLRQAITNANTLGGDSTLAQAGRGAGVESLVLMISNGSAGSGGSLSLSGGLRSSNNYFSAGVATITPASALPALSTSMTLDGQAQPGWTANPVVELNGTSAGAGVDGLALSGTPVRVRGLVINRFKRHGIYATGASATVQGCWIGVSNAGSASAANSGSGIYTAGSGHTIGGTTAANGNVVSGNTQYGVVLSADSGATGTSTVSGNFIGTNAAGGAALPNTLNGIYVLTTGNTVGGSVAGAGNVVSGNTQNGVQLDAGSNTIQGNTIGLNAAGSAALANGATGLYIGAGTGNTIGGASSLQRNILGGNVGAGIFVSTGGSNIIQGNYIGTSADGASAVGNGGFFGIELYGSGGNTVGGTATGTGNLISGQSGAGKGGVFLASNGNTLQGNLIGTNAAASAGLPNAGPGVAVLVTSITGNTIGGTAAGAGNTIAYNGQQGVVISGASSTGNKISANAIYANSGIGIDIAAAGRNANNGTKSATLGNQEMDTPVFTAATLNGSTLTVSGYVGSAAGQSVFAAATVEIFKVAADGTGFGQGKTYLGSVTADASGNLSALSLTVSGIVAGDAITATATDAAGNTSEFSANATTIAPGISGTVFEDPNYGGGSGRNKAAALAGGGSGRPNARVELVSVSGTTGTVTAVGFTDASGNYSFSGVTPGNYYLRVLSSSVTSGRSGAVASLIAVTTYHANAPAGVAVDITDEVGGRAPAFTTYAATPANVGATSPTTVDYSDAIATVTVSNGVVSGIDFGFSFSVVTNVNDSGQGSLRQAIINANTLAGDSSLAQAGRTAGIENLVFMISNGTAGNGLRSANNFFSGGVATIAPTSALPALSTPMVVDAQTQPGWSANPLVQLNGTSGGATFGLSLTGGGTTLRGFIVNRWSTSGISLSSTGNTVQGCWVGLNSAGTAASANTSAGIVVTAGGNVIGGTSASARNVISGNGVGNGTGNAGLLISSGATNTVQGNYIGLNAAGTAAVANLPYGVDITSTGNTLGGTAAGAGNVMSGNTLDGAIFRPGADGSTIQGNTFGANAANSAVVANGRLGLDLQSNNNTVGGTATNAANIVRGNTLGGVAVVGSVGTGNNLSANSIYGNGGVGIDLAYNGLTANDGVKTANQPNLLMDYPVFSAASISGGTLTVAGYVGSATGQTVFAGARIEVFASDGSNANGQGQTYLGFLTADANGNFSGSLSGVAGVTSGSTKITATATDAAGNTSEFGPNLLVGMTLSGRVFEDVNYGGGAGRSYAASAGVGLASATVELFDAGGNYVSSTTTAAGGTWSFSGIGNGNYFVRVVGASVASQRTGTFSTLRPVMTFRTNATSGSAVAVTDWVGGTSPAATEPGTATTGAAINTATYVFSAGLSGTAQALAPVTMNNAALSGVDFGFNFDTVTHTNDSGPGSLRMVIGNVNTLGGDASLAQAGRTAGIENIVFMISNGSAGSGLRSTLNYFSSGVASIAPVTQLPTLTTPVVLNAQTQPGWTATPVLRIDGTNAGASSAGLVVGCTGCSVRGFAINNAYAGLVVSNGNTVTLAGNYIGIDPTGASAAANRDSGIVVANSSAVTIGGTSGVDRNVIAGNTKSGVYLDTGSSTTTIVGNYIGTNASGAAAVANNPSASTSHAGIFLNGVAGTQIGGTSAGQRNLISGNGRNGISAVGGSATVVTGNYIGTNAAGAAAIGNSNDGVNVSAVGTFTIGGSANGSGNVISGNGASGIYANDPASSPLVVQGNFIGIDAAGTAALPNYWGVYIDASGVQVGGVSAGEGNVISGNASIGVVVKGSPATGVRVLRNSIYGNGSIGIDLRLDGVTPNDGLKMAGASNLLMDSPVFTSARATANRLVVAGYVGSAAGQSVFAGARVDVYLSDNDASGYGEGKTWLGTLTADASGNFSATLTMPVAGLAIGSKLTATATDGSNNTSEFGANFAGLIVDLVVNSNLDEADTSAGDGFCLTASGVCTLRAAIAELNAWSALASPPSIVFAIPGCTTYGSAGCRISPATALPSVLRSVLIDGSTQTGFNSGTYAPIIEIDGSGTPAGTSGLVIAGTGSTVRGLSIARFPSNGITLSGNNGTLAGMRLGLNVNTAATAANGGAGAYITGSGAVIGTAAAADRNTIAGNTGSGLLIAASGASVSGNFIGTDAAGSSGLGNGASGVFTQSASLSGITVSTNTIANNSGNGVTVAGGAAQVQMLANAISGNGGIGIDLGNDGVTANTGSTNASKPNNGMNQPVVTGAGVGSGSMTVYGYVGTGSGNAAFANVRVEFFKAAADPSGYGEGQTYLGFLTTDANGRFSGSVAFSAGAINAGDALTATATDAAGNTSEFGPNWTTTSIAALTPGSFNAFDTDAVASALTGVIRSRTAAAATTLAVIALDSSGTALHPGFTGTVALSWVDARNDSGAASGSCRSSWVDLGAAGSAVFSNNSRLTVNVTPPSSGTRAMRLKMSYTPASGGTVVACSNDAFADLPASLAWIGASDADSATAGTARALANSAASGGNVHRAGRPFTVRAQALDAAGAVMSGYDGSPVLATAGCLLPSGCSAGVLTAAGTAAVAGNYTHSNVSYAEVGAIQLQLTDSNYADVDIADTTAGVRTLTSMLLTVGRFSPDSLSVTLSTSGQFATANGSCLASGSGATFIGQGYTWATAPQLTVTAKNAAGATTAGWTGSLMKLSAAMVAETLAATGTGSATLSSSFGATAVSDLGGGQARVSASATDRFLLDLPAGTVQDSVTPAFIWTASLADNSEAATGGNPTLSASASQAGVGFNSGAIFYSGRLGLSPGYGDSRAGVRLLAQLQRYTAAGWVTMTEDQGCVTINPANVGVEAPVGVFTTAGSCAAPMSAAVTTRGGRAWLALPATPGGAPGRLTVRIAGGGASGNSCTAAGASAALVNIGQPWLLGGASAAGPQAFATWGLPQRDALLRREVW